MELERENGILNFKWISMAIYVRGTYRQTQLFYWLIIGRFTTTRFGPIPGPSSGCITT